MQPTTVVQAILLAAPVSSLFSKPVLTVGTTFAPGHRAALNWRFWTIDDLGAGAPGWA